MPRSPSTRRRIALLLAGGTLAVGVPAAVASAGGDAAPAAGGDAPATEFIQQEPRSDAERKDCPERDGSGGGSGSQQEPRATATPETGDV